MNQLLTSPLSRLFWAASGGHEKIASLLLDYEDTCGSHSTAADIQAAFNEAADNGHLEIMRMLRKRRTVTLNQKNKYDATPLERAAQKGHIPIISFLIDEGALLEEQTQGNKALIAAASSGHFEVIKVLCREGKVSPSVVDEQGRNALYYAASSKDSTTSEENGLDIAAFLLSRGLDPNPVPGAEGPLHQAVVHDHPKMITLLLDHGADPRRKGNGWCPLTLALRYKSPSALTLLLQAAISDPAARQAWLEEGLRYACRAGDRNAVLQLLQADATISINCVEVSGQPKGATPLLLSLLNGHIKVAQLLIRRGARSDLADAQGRLPLFVAAEKGYESVVRDLVRAGAAVDAPGGEDEDTALIVAAKGGHEKVVRVLLDHGAERERENKFGERAQDVAEEKNHEEVIKLLGGGETCSSCGSCVSRISTPRESR